MRHHVGARAAPRVRPEQGGKPDKRTLHRIAGDKRAHRFFVAEREIDQGRDIVAVPFAGAVIPGKRGIAADGHVPQHIWRVELQMTVGARIFARKVVDFPIGIFEGKRAVLGLVENGQKRFFGFLVEHRHTPRRIAHRDLFLGPYWGGRL